MVLSVMGDSGFDWVDATREVPLYAEAHGRA
jgi:hypothetical protein